MRNRPNGKNLILVSLVFSAGNCFVNAYSLKERSHNRFMRIVKYVVVPPLFSIVPHLHVICCSNSPTEPKTCFIIIYFRIFVGDVVAVVVAVHELDSLSRFVQRNL